MGSYTMAEGRTLECGVVGAGIGGLAAAIALSRAGHHVTIYERSHFKHEIGAAITMTPNANLILDHWGLDAAKARETEKQQTRRCTWDTMECAYQDSFDGVRKTFGHAFNAFHRVDLHNGLRDVAQAQASIDIVLGSDIEGVDCEKGNLIMANGVQIKKDMLVLADGIKTRFLKTITGLDITAQQTPKSVFRTLIPIDRLMADQQTRSLFQDRGSGFLTSNPSPSGTMMVTYPCRRDEIMNVAIFHNTRTHQQDAHDWNSHATVDDALEVLDGFHPGWKAIASHADFMKVYTINNRAETPTMVRGRAVIIGDAAHPMMPTHAQGGCMALEDAAALEILFADLSPSDSVEGRLKLFDQLRVPRCATTQILSNAMFYREIAHKEVLIGKYYRGPLLPPDAEGWSEPVREFFYSYDAFREARKALQYKDEVAGIPDGAIQHFGRRASVDTDGWEHQIDRNHLV